MTTKKAPAKKAAAKKAPAKKAVAKKAASTKAPTQAEGTTTWIAFLRAVNVGGRVAKMERVRALFAELGMTRVRSYIQSGNVFFDADEGIDRAALTERIQDQLEADLGFDVPTVLVTVDEVEAAIALEPFVEVDVTEDTRLNFLFLSAPLPTDTEFPLTATGFEVLGATPNVAFLVMTLQNGRPGNPATFIEKTYGVKATARFAHTTEKIVAAAKAG